MTDNNVVWHHATVTRNRREELNGHKSVIVWFTGLSNSGKSTIAHAAEELLFSQGCRTFVFDGDNVRHGLCADLGFAFHETFGYLTSCPTNLGTGMRASVLLHLPGLVFSSEVEKALKGATNLGINIRGIYGEGTEIRGNLFQISNQHTLGLKEEDLIETMTKFARMIIDVESKTRDIIIKKARVEFEDKVARSLAILRSARILSSNEVLNLLSAVRMGIGQGIIQDVTLDEVNEIMLVSRPANLQLYFGEILEEHERDIRRAEYVRRRLAEKKEPGNRGTGEPEK